MITNTYDLNLYVIDGYIKVLAHQLEISSEGHLQAGSEFIEALKFPYKRKNRELWQPLLEFFGEDELYDELDSWYGVPVYDDAIPFDSWETMGYIPGAPQLLALALSQLPSYEVGDWR
jgi:hypothetical protein